MEIKVERIDVSKDYRRQKIYTPIDITEQVVMPILDTERLDTTLDSSSMTLINREDKPLAPFTKIIVTMTNAEGEQEKIYRVVHKDTVTKYTYDEMPKYTHEIALLEPTKLLERGIVDNTTITNLLAFLYSEEGANIYEWAPAIKTNEIERAYNFLIGIVRYDIYSASYKNDTRVLSVNEINSSIKTNLQFTVTIRDRLYLAGLILQATSYHPAQLDYFTIKDPDGNITTIQDFNSEYKFTKLGVYTIEQKYNYVDYPSSGLSVIYQWTTQVVPAGTNLKVPTRRTIKEVVDLILQKVGTETSLLRDGIDSPTYQLDPNVAEQLSKITSPEFTFTQNTLFGMLNEIGGAIMAIPRLIPFKVTVETTDEQGQTTTSIDDYSQWNVITFDFLGARTPTVNGEQVAIENSIDGDNYATSMVCNIENSFQTNNADYVAITEPYEGGYMSTRTEEANFEISNNHAVIKTAQPIQRIIQVLCKYADESPIDITKFVLESADYSVLSDYNANSTTLEEAVGNVTKSNVIYFTRGDNVIRGLDYVPPSVFTVQVFGQTQAILNIIRGVKGLGQAPNVALKDLMFNIKYIPYSSFKASQYKVNIDDNSGGNELYYNQINTQVVDIENFGENLKGALMRTANEEPVKTEYFKDFLNVIKAGQVTSDGYYAYQVDREITNYRIKATTTFSKDWNKLNEFVGISKNYREWEISESESLGTNPIYNEFCIIGNQLDIDKNQGATQEEIDAYKAELAEYGGFLSNKAIEQIYNRLLNSPVFDFKSLTWLAATTQSMQYAGAGEYERVSNSFLLPVTCVSFGNSILLHFATKDNYAVGTYADDHGNPTYALENFVKYGDKTGRVEKLALCFGAEDALIDGFNTYANAKKTSKQLYQLPVTYTARNPVTSWVEVDDIDVGSYTLYQYQFFVNSADFSQYAVGDSIYYNDTERYIIKSVDESNYSFVINVPDFSALYNALTSLPAPTIAFSEAESKLNTSAILLDYREHPFIYNKDSRQKMEYTGQLHFVVDNNPNIWLGKGFAQMMPFVGNTANEILKFVLFTKAPDKFLTQIDPTIWQEKTMPTCVCDYDLKYIEYEPTTVDMDCVGFGFVDNQNRVVLYYNKELKAGDSTEPIYFQFRRRI